MVFVNTGVAKGAGSMATTDMTDDVKKVLAMVPLGYKADHAQLWAHLQILAAHIDSEDARSTAALDAQLARLTREFSAETAAAVAAAREEQREACARYIKARMQTNNWYDDQVRMVLAYLRDTYLTATPLADRIAGLTKAHAVMADAMHRMEAQRNEARDRAEKAEAERDLARAQVEAARANCQEILGNRREAMQARSAVGQVLAAMDGAKP